LRTVEELAAEHLTSLRKVRPHGPYLLAGWSFGGLIAWEMRRRLIEAGEEVPLLSMVDSWPAGVDLGQVSEVQVGEVPRRLFDLVTAHTEAALAWRPAPPGGRTLLLLAAAEPGGAGRCAAIEEAWARCGAAPLSSHRLDGTHWTLLTEPRVREAAERIEEHLNDLEVPTP
jgi:thioesterase domain-containing protein